MRRDTSRQLLLTQSPSWPSASAIHCTIAAARDIISLDSACIWTDGLNSSGTRYYGSLISVRLTSLAIAATTWSCCVARE